MVSLCYSWDRLAVITHTHRGQVLWHHLQTLTAGIQHPSNTAQGHWTKSASALKTSPNLFKDPSVQCNFFNCYFHSGKSSFALIGNTIEVEKKKLIFGYKRMEVISNSLLLMNSSPMQLSLSLSLPQQGATVIEHTFETKTEDDKQAYVTWFPTPVFLLSSSPSLSSSCHLASCASSLPLNHVRPDY